MAPQRSPVKPRARDVLVAAFACLGVALVFTWPLLPSLHVAIPAGGEPATVALLNLAVLQHLADWLAGQADFWQMPIFAPHKGALAWTEAQPLSGILYAAGVAVGLPAATVYNLLLLAYLSGAGAVTWLAVRLFTEDRLAALLAAAWVTAGAFAVHRMAALHLVALGFPLLFVYALLRLVDQWSRRWLWLAAAAAVATWYTCAQYLVLVALVTVPAALISMPWRRLGWRQIGEAALAVGVALLAILPMALAWRQRLQSMGFSRDPAMAVGPTRLTLLLQPAPGHWWLPPTPPPMGHGSVQSWDVGAVLLVVLLVSVLVARRRPQAPVEVAPRGALFLATVALFATALAMSPQLHLAGTTPWRLICDQLPALAGVRTPGRVVFLTGFVVAVLGGAGLAWLRAARPRWRHPLAILAGLALIAEMWTMPVALVRPADGVDDHAEVLSWLAGQGGRSSVAELPTPAGLDPAQLEAQARAMARGRRHGRPVTGGYSGYLPEPFWQLADALRADPGGRGRRYLRALAAGHLLVHEHALDSATLRQVQAAFADLPARRFGSDVVYTIGAPTHAGLPPIPDQKGSAPPKPGELLALRLHSPVSEATLVGPDDLPEIGLCWSSVCVAAQLVGTALLDAGQKTLPARVLRAGAVGEIWTLMLGSVEQVHDELGLPTTRKYKRD